MSNATKNLKSRKIGSFTVQYTPPADEDCSLVWDVIGADGQMEDTFATRNEAVAYAKELAETELEDMTAEAVSLIEAGADVDTLRKILALLKK